MKISIYKCDACGEEIKASETIHKVQMAEVNRKTKEPESEEISRELGKLHFCKSCSRELFRIICEFETTKTREKATVSPEKPIKSKKIDNGKVMALHKAGWSVRQIWEELGTTDYTLMDVEKAIIQGKINERMRRGGLDV